MQFFCQPCCRGGCINVDRKKHCWSSLFTYRMYDAQDLPRWYLSYDVRTIWFDVYFSNLVGPALLRLASSWTSAVALLAVNFANIALLGSNLPVGYPHKHLHTQDLWMQTFHDKPRTLFDVVSSPSLRWTSQNRPLPSKSEFDLYFLTRNIIYKL